MHADLKGYLSPIRQLSTLCRVVINDDLKKSHIRRVVINDDLFYLCCPYLLQRFIPQPIPEQRNLRIVLA
jgi:hypothetical protein